MVLLRSDRPGQIINIAITNTNGFLSIYGVFLKSKGQDVNEIKNYHICFDGITTACQVYIYEKSAQGIKHLQGMDLLALATYSNSIVIFNATTGATLG